MGYNTNCRRSDFIRFTVLCAEGVFITSLQIIAAGFKNYNFIKILINLFKIAGVLLFIFWVPAFADFIRWLSPVAQGTGVEKLAAETPRQIANAHTIFNVSLAFIFLPFTTIFANVILKILPQLSLIEGIQMRERKTDFLEEKITNYQMRIFRQELAADQVKELFAMISIVKDMENIGDVIDKNMIPLIPKKQALMTDIFPEGKEELQIYHTKVCKQISRLKHAFAERDIKKASKIMEKEEKYLDLESLWCRRLIN